jgi:hypothetical protein
MYIRERERERERERGRAFFVYVCRRDLLTCA